MKQFILLSLIFLSIQVYAQTEVKGGMQCDSVIFIDGTIKLVQVNEVNRRKVIYTLCCYDCAVPREFKKNEIDTIIYFQEDWIDQQTQYLDNVNAQTTDSTNSFSGINLTSGKKSFLIPIEEKITVKTNTINITGLLESVDKDHLYVNGYTILKNEIEVIKYIPTKKRKIRNAFLLSAAASLAGVVGFGYWYWGSGEEWSAKAGGVLLVYTPVGLITGIILSKKQKFKLNGEWQLTILE